MQTYLLEKSQVLWFNIAVLNRQSYNAHASLEFSREWAYSKIQVTIIS